MRANYENTKSEANLGTTGMRNPSRKANRPTVQNQHEIIDGPSSYTEDRAFKNELRGKILNKN